MGTMDFQKITEFSGKLISIFFCDIFDGLI